MPAKLNKFNAGPFLKKQHEKHRMFSAPSLVILLLHCKLFFKKRHCKNVCGNSHPPVPQVDSQKKKKKKKNLIIFCKLFGANQPDKCNLNYFRTKFSKRMEGTKNLMSLHPLEPNYGYWSPTFDIPKE